MSKRRYTHVQGLLPEIKRKKKEGKTNREIAEEFGLANKDVVKQLLTRERRKEEKLKLGILPRSKGRPGKEGPEAELERLRMENQLLRDFLQLTGRK